MKLQLRNRRVLDEKTGQWQDKHVYLINDEEVDLAAWEAAWAKIAEKRAKFGDDGEIFGTEVGGQRPACWPHVSGAMAVHPSQVNEANAMMKADGINAYHTPDGKLVTPDNAARKKVMKWKGVRDNDAFC